MRVTFLGVGGWVSMHWLNHPSILVESSTDARILLDAGEGSYRQLMRCRGIGVESIDAVVLTHGHGDHILGIPTFILMAASSGVKLSVIAPRYVIDDIYGLLRHTHIEKYSYALNPIAVNIPERPAKIAEVKGVSVYAVKADHTVDSMAIRLVDSDGSCIVYSGDTRPTESLVDLAKGCRLLIHEASGNPGYEREAHEHGHSTTADAVEVALKAGVSTLALTHFYIMNPTIHLANGGLRVIVPYECSTVEA